MSVLSSCALNTEQTCDLQHSLHHFYTHPHSATSKPRLKLFYCNRFGSFYRYGHTLGRFWMILSCLQPSLSVNTSRTFKKRGLDPSFEHEAQTSQEMCLIMLLTHPTRFSICTSCRWLFHFNFLLKGRPKDHVIHFS
jgi:hypothetical protein